MELREEISTINRQLIDHFGIDTVTGQPMWRVVWANDVRERRLVTHTDTGIELLNPEVREVRKYQTVNNRYVLERLIALDPIAELEYPGQKTYYYPMWVFNNRIGEYLPPFFEGCKFVVDRTYHNEGKVNFWKIYNDPEDDPQTKIDRIDRLVDELFGENPAYTEHNHNTVIGFHPSKD